MMALRSEERVGEIQVMTVRRNGDGAEIDVVVRDLLLNRSVLLEVKNSDKAVDEQSRWLRDGEFMEKISFCMGNPLVRCVLYNGNDEEDGSVLWRNAEAFLTSLRPGMHTDDIAKMLSEGCQKNIRKPQNRSVFASASEDQAPTSEEVGADELFVPALSF